MRQKELKRNKKQRIMVRNAIVKSRNPENLVEQLRRMDDQGRELVSCRYLVRDN